MVVAHHLGGVTRKHQSTRGQSGRAGLLPAPACFWVVPSHSVKKGSFGLALMVQSRMVLNF